MQHNLVRVAFVTGLGVIAACGTWCGVTQVYMEGVDGVCPDQPEKLTGSTDPGESCQNAADCKPTCCACDPDADGGDAYLAAGCSAGKCLAYDTVCSVSGPRVNGNSFLKTGFVLGYQQCGATRPDAGSPEARPCLPDGGCPSPFRCGTDPVTLVQSCRRPCDSSIDAGPPGTAFTGVHDYCLIPDPSDGGGGIVLQNCCLYGQRCIVDLCFGPMPGEIGSSCLPSYPACPGASMCEPGIAWQAIPPHCVAAGGPDQPCAPDAVGNRTVCERGLNCFVEGTLNMCRRVCTPVDGGSPGSPIWLDPTNPADLARCPQAADGGPFLANCCLEGELCRSNGNFDCYHP